MKNKYHIEGIGKNKKIMEQRKRPLPLELMINKCINCGNDIKNNVFSVCDDCWDKL